MTTPAGWYPDNTSPGNERYWDGSQWTEQSRPVAGQPFGATPPAAPGWTPPPAVGGQKNWFLRHKVLTGIGALLLIGIISSAAGSGGSTDNNNASDDSPAATVSESPAAQPVATRPAATKPKPAAPKPAGLTYAGKKDGDKAVKSGGAVELSGWTTVISALTKKHEEYVGDYLCANVLMVNRDKETQRTGVITMQAPNGQVEDSTFFGSGDTGYESYQDIAPGGKVQSVVCFDYKKTFGTGSFLVAWQPDTFSSEDRGVWLNSF